MMMRVWGAGLLALTAGLTCGAAPAHPHPDPVQALGAVRNVDGTVTLSWSLPADPTVVGLTIDRERLDGSYDLDTFVLIGLATDFTDTTAHGSRSYRYTVYTRDGAGNFSVPVWVETWDDDHHHHGGHGRWRCHSSIGAVEFNAALPLAALLLAALLAFRRRGTA